MTDQMQKFNADMQKRYREGRRQRAVNEVEGHLADFPSDREELTASLVEVLRRYAAREPLPSALPEPKADQGEAALEAAKAQLRQQPRALDVGKAGMTPAELATAGADTLVHLLWTKAVGAPDYVKAEWTALSRLVEEMIQAQSKSTGKPDFTVAPVKISIDGEKLAEAMCPRYDVELSTRSVLSERTFRCWFLADGKEESSAIHGAAWEGEAAALFAARPDGLQPLARVVIVCEPREIGETYTRVDVDTTYRDRPRIIDVSHRVLASSSEGQRWARGSKFVAAMEAPIPSIPEHAKMPVFHAMSPEAASVPPEAPKVADLLEVALKGKPTKVALSRMSKAAMDAADLVVDPVTWVAIKDRGGRVPRSLKLGEVVAIASALGKLDLVPKILGDYFVRYANTGSAVRVFRARVESSAADIVSRLRVEERHLFSTGDAKNPHEFVWLFYDYGPISRVLPAVGGEDESYRYESARDPRDNEIPAADRTMLVTHAMFCKFDVEDRGALFNFEEAPKKPEEKLEEVQAALKERLDDLSNMLEKSARREKAMERLHQISKLPNWVDGLSLHPMVNDGDESLTLIVRFSPEAEEKLAMLTDEEAASLDLSDMPAPPPLDPNEAVMKDFVRDAGCAEGPRSRGQR